MPRFTFNIHILKIRGTVENHGEIKQKENENRAMSVAPSRYSLGFLNKAIY